MQRLQTRLIVLLMASLLVLVPAVYGQEAGRGYTEVWRQWRLRELQVYPAADAQGLFSAGLKTGDAWAANATAELEAVRANTAARSSSLTIRINRGH